MKSGAFLRYLQHSKSYEKQVVHVEHLVPRSATHGELEDPLATHLESALERRGMLPLYSHQVAAIEASRSGHNVTIVTSTASGKTLCYHIPVLESILTQKQCRALYLFPTKALAQDQLRGLANLTAPPFPPLQCATFDGDTPQSERSEIKKHAQIVITNPDMLHLGMLPNHKSWSKFFRQLKYVVLDESHIYRGVFGSHVSNVLRRLRRICALYNANPLFICSSATIGNSQEHVERLVGLPFEIIEKDGSPHGGKDFVFWNPPFIDQARSSRRSANSEASYLFTELVRHKIRTLTFTRTRKLTELIYSYSRDQLGPDLAKKIKPYRGGYLAEDRRKIERELFDGELTGVVATTALELGIDIGDLEATVLTGYPGSIASAWQQAGRSGRKSNNSLSFLVGSDSPLDQYFMRYPEAFFGKRYESALTNPSNPYVLKPHLLCAAWELPLTGNDTKYFGTDFTRVRDELEQEGLLKNQNKRWYVIPTIAYPAENVNIRSTFSHQYTVLDTSKGNRLLETVDATIAMSQLHPGAIYLHQGESYLVTELDITAHVAFVEHTNITYYTQAREITDLRITKVIRKKNCGVDVCLGNVEVTSNVVGYRKKMQYTEQVIGEEPLEMPPQSIDTMAIWFDVPDTAITQIEDARLDFPGGLHAVEHAAIGMLPLFALCDRNDIGGVSTPLHPDTGKPQIFIHDAHPGGGGIAEKGFEVINRLWEVTLKTIEECPCEDGCPSCIQSPKCGNNNYPLDKKAAEIILKELTS